MFSRIKSFLYRLLPKEFAGSTGLGRAWVEDHSPMLVNLRKRMERESPFRGLRFTVCLPETWETLMLLSVLEAGGASITLVPMFCKLDVHSELVKRTGVILSNFLNRGNLVRDSDFIWDCDALFADDLIKVGGAVKGVIEQTSSGVKVYKEYDSQGLLTQPVLDLDSSQVKRVRENKLATGLGLVEALLRLHIFLPNKRVLVVGFGNVGSSCALYLKGLGCSVDVYDVDASQMREAESLGYHTGDLRELLPLADIVVTATGSRVPALDSKEFRLLKRGAILANMGGNGWNRNVFSGKRTQRVGAEVLKVFLDNDSFFYELASGAPVNLILGSGTDIETMDKIFFMGALTMEYLVKNYDSLPRHVLPVPEIIQKRVI